MKAFQVNVSQDAEEFYLAFNTGWKKLAGHLIEVEDLKFSVIPVGDFMRLSEFESGAKIVNIPVSEHIQTYEETMLFMGTVVAATVVQLIHEHGIDKIKEQTDLIKKEYCQKHGERPSGKKINTDWLKADISAQLH